MKLWTITEGQILKGELVNFQKYSPKLGGTLPSQDLHWLGSDLRGFTNLIVTSCH
jgi:hypothetical protein